MLERTDPNPVPPASESAAAVVVAQNVARWYGEGEARTDAVRGVSVSLNAGEITTLVGPSGSGKSTLLHLLAGLEAPSAGQVLLEDRPLHSMSERELAGWRARHMAFVLQKDNLIPALTLAENVAAPLLVQGRPRRRALERAEALLDRVALSHRAGAFPVEVSGGEAQRAAVARACVGEPRIVFADEPTGALDSASGKIVLELLTSLVHEHGAAALIVTHDQRVARAGDRRIKMTDGLLEGGC